ncbi:MAG: UDP-3-O-(3-hydroxymyristoyl)glucosamine N-acyltransferase [Desulfobacula sp.]|nr:UDP-3-O-(3-hydroxymyristoyl)glucosamine N-acyltransferase [Desulfobacula sp.]
MELSVKEIAKIINASVTGDDDFLIKGVSSFQDSNSHDITFASDSKFLNKLVQTSARAVIIPDSHVFDDDSFKDKILLKVKNPKISFFNIVSIFHPVKEKKPGIHPNSDIGFNVNIGKNCIIQSNVVIGDNVTIGDNVHLMPGTFIADDVVIGANTLIKPNVTVMEKSIIGENVIIHPGTTIGSDGFGFAQNSEKHEKLIHTGYVKIGNDVEIGAGNTIDRGTLGTTTIGNGVKTDNLVHIAHNVKVGDNTLIVAQVAIAGSTTIGKNVIIAGKSAITGHIKVGDGSIVGPFTGVYSNVPENEIVSGIPQMPHKRWRKVVSIISRLPEIRKKLFSMEKRIKNLELK